MVDCGWRVPFLLIPVFIFFGFLFFVFDWWRGDRTRAGWVQRISPSLVRYPSVVTFENIAWHSSKVPLSQIVLPCASVQIFSAVQGIERLMTRTWRPAGVFPVSFIFLISFFVFVSAVVASIWDDYLSNFENRQQFFSIIFHAPRSRMNTIAPPSDHFVSVDKLVFHFTTRSTNREMPPCISTGAET